MSFVNKFNSAKDAIETILDENNLDFWIVSINNPKYASEPLDSSEHRITLSKQEAINLVFLFIRSTFGRNKPSEINGATVEGLSDAEIIKIIGESLTEQNMVLLDDFRFDIVKSSLY